MAKARNSMEPLFPDDNSEKSDALPENSSSPSPNSENDSAANVPAGGDSEEALWLSPQDFQPPFMGIRPPNLPGPGLLESFAWVGGIFGLQIIGSVIVMVAILAYFLLTLDSSDRAGIMQSLRDPSFTATLQQKFQIHFITGTQLLFMLGVLVAARMRLGKNFGRRLSLLPIRAGHFFLVVLLIVPMAILSNQFYQMADLVWKMLVEQFPGLSVLDGMNSMEIIPQLAEQGSLPVLLLALAVVPAVAEELVFRGVIGRGLTARYGLPLGVFMTTLFFAAVHLHPAHVASVIPLGIAMHLVYLTTRSFWAPVLYHFLNNALAVFALKIDAFTQAEPLADQSEISIGVLLLALLSVSTIVALLWQTRVRYILPDGTAWDPGHASLEQPPFLLQARRSCQSAPVWLVLATFVSVVAFLSTLAP